MLDDDAEKVGRGRHIEKEIAVLAVIVIDLPETIFEARISGGIVEISADVVDALDEVIPDFCIDGAAGKFLEIFSGLFARVLVAHGTAAEADDGEIGREQLLAGEIVERGDELAAREVSGKAEDDHDAGVGHASGAD